MKVGKRMTRIRAAAAEARHDEMAVVLLVDLVVTGAMKTKAIMRPEVQEEEEEAGEGILSRNMPLLLLDPPTDPLLRSVRTHTRRPYLPLP